MQEAPAPAEYRPRLEAPATSRSRPLPESCPAHPGHPKASCTLCRTTAAAELKLPKRPRVAPASRQANERLVALHQANERARAARKNPAAPERTAEVQHQEEPMAEPEKRKCDICGDTFQPDRRTGRFCTKHTKGERVNWTRQHPGRPRAAPAPSIAEEVSTMARELDAARVLRALGWHVDELGVGPNGRTLLAVGAAP